MRFFYSLLWYFALPAVALHLAWRAFTRPTYRAHWAQRFGFFNASHSSSGVRIWIHAVSVGETRAAQPLIVALLKTHSNANILLTHMTPTGRKAGVELYSKLIEDKRLQQAYLPYDYGFAMRRFLSFWQPQLGLVMETEVWPNLMAIAQKRGLPMALVNARLSEKSLRKGLRFQSLMTEAVGRFDVIVAQSAQDSVRISKFVPSKKITVAGNIKFDVNAPEEKIALGQTWRDQVGRPVLLLASSRDGEEQLFFEAIRKIRELNPDALPSNLLIIVVPRHPERFATVNLLAAKEGFTVANRSAQMPLPETQVWIGDSMGEMFAYYSMACVALLGGSFGAFGAQNLLEPMAVGCPIVVGPSRFNFDHIISEALLSGGAIGADSMSEAIKEACHLLANPDAGRRVGTAGTTFCAAHTGAALKTLLALEPLLGPHAS